MNVLFDKGDSPCKKVIYVQGTFENKHVLFCLLLRAVFLAELVGE